jgi:hemerythrin
MPLFTWKDSLSVKIESIDKEHKNLINMLNEFYENIISKTNQENISELISKMKDYTIFHFTNEERLLREHNYPKFNEHKKEHEKFIEKVSDMEKRFKEGKLILSLEVTSFLKDWLQNHIMVTDKQYSDFLERKGIK